MRRFASLCGISEFAEVLRFAADGARRYGHQHASRCKFQSQPCGSGQSFLAHRGELLIAEAGYSDYYKDPFYRPYVIQALGHNTLLVDGDPESQSDAGQPLPRRLSRKHPSSLGEEFDAVRADLTAAYRIASSDTRER